MNILPSRVTVAFTAATFAVGSISGSRGAGNGLSGTSQLGDFVSTTVRSSSEINSEILIMAKPQLNLTIVFKIIL